MDQESFRKLLHAPKASSSSITQGGTAHVRGSLLAPAPAAGGKGKGKKAKAPPGDASQTAFKPRQVKKSGGGASEAYRNRAEERRLGLKGDYAQVRRGCCVCVCARTGGRGSPSRACPLLCARCWERGADGVRSAAGRGAGGGL